MKSFVMLLACVMLAVVFAGCSFIKAGQYPDPTAGDGISLGIKGAYLTSLAEDFAGNKAIIGWKYQNEEGSQKTLMAKGLIDIPYLEYKKSYEQGGFMGLVTLLLNSIHLCFEGNDPNCSVVVKGAQLSPEAHAEMQKIIGK